MSKFIFTCGDVNGIGPELAIKTINKITSHNYPDIIYLICPSNVFYNTIKHINPEFNYEIVKDIKNETNSFVTVIDIGNAKQRIGKATVTSGKTAYKALRTSYDILNSGNASAVITAPVSKTAINMAGFDFRGQTETFAKWTKSSSFVMTFLSKKMNAALFSTHSPLKDVYKILKTSRLEDTIKIIYQMLENDLGVSKPKIAVLGFNPHAGENGIIGKEEISVIAPVINRLKKLISVEGPFSSDAFFANRRYKDFDITLGMYHDQVLIPFKLLNFGKGVNYTAGLPFVRTSPDHGVAYDIADKYIADESSMVQAYKYARRIVRNRKRINEN
ncbi:MAG: 4-hydroxythreonine-4-phosphate dehydrogenase PdxA [Ignavibacterium sp.]|nr:MAG: 4-hydroxythreonine-4-phosphate dehydrogenase PdxA [Ignavibacterium sp.]